MNTSMLMAALTRHLAVCNCRVIVLSEVFQLQMLLVDGN